MKQELCITETFGNRLFDSNRQRKTPTVIRHLLSRPRQPILHSNIFFYVKFFATIISSWNSLKFILWYLFELSDPFNKKKNSVFPILTQKNFEQKIYNWGILKWNPILSIELGQRLPKSFSQLHVRNSIFFRSYFLKKDDWPKAYAGPRLPTLPYQILNINFW